jgi:hypothetical protein
LFTEPSKGTKRGLIFARDKRIAITNMALAARALLTGADTDDLLNQILLGNPHDWTPEEIEQLLGITLVIQSEAGFIFCAVHFIGKYPMLHFTLIDPNSGAWVTIVGRPRDCILPKMLVTGVKETNGDAQVFVGPSMALGLLHLRNKHNWDERAKVYIGIFHPNDPRIHQYRAHNTIMPNLAFYGVVEGLLAAPAAWACYNPTLQTLEAYAING